MAANHPSPVRTSRVRWPLGIAGALLTLLALWQIVAAGGGLQIERFVEDDLPLVLITPAEGGTDRPLVLVAHGFAGSKQLMRGFGLALGHAGYTALLWDFDGHGANPASLSGDRAEPLLNNATTALMVAERRHLADLDRVAILGHSMGSGVALAFGQTYPDTAATIAVSPVGRSVTPELPRNLLLMAGELEPAFVANAEERLAEAGGAGGDPALGTARELTLVPGVEHISILFSPTAHRAAVDWLDATFGPQPGRADYADRRILWWGVGLLGVLALGAAVAPLVLDEEQDPMPHRSRWWRLIAPLLGGLGASLLLGGLGAAGLQLPNLMGVTVGGYVLVWMALAGVLSLLLLRSWPGRPSGRALLGGLLAGVALWAGTGLLAQIVWLQWLLIPRRLILWPLGALLALPWFLAQAMSMGVPGRAARLGWWLVQGLSLVIGLLAALRLTPELGFLMLILPVLPLVVGFHALAAGPYRRQWAFALSGALWLSWALLGIFPLQ